MASAKSLEDMLSQDVDESAVSALVGSLESQLASTSNHIPSQELNSGAVTSNHVNITTVVDGTLQRLHDGQKHGVVGSLNQANPISNSNKSLTTNSQIVGINSVVSASSTPTSTIMVTLPGALPASGYINQVSGTPALLNSAAASLAGRSVNNSDIKIVYSPQPSAPVTQYSTCTNVSSVNSTVVQGQRSAIKVTSVSNGNAGGVNLNVTRPGQPLVTVTSVAPVLTGSAGRPTTPQSTQSAAAIGAIHNLANIAAQQPPLVIPSSAQATSQHQSTALVAATAQQVTSQISSINSKQLTVGRFTVREQLEQKQTDKVIIKPQIIFKDASSPIPPVTPPSQMSDSGTAGNASAHSGGNVIQVSSSTPTVITVSKPVQSQQQHHQPGQPINVVTQVVSNPNLISGVQIVNVNTARPGAPGVAGQKTLAPRVVIGNPVRIAAAPQVITARPGTPGVQVAGQNTFTLPGMVRGTLLVKTENGQLQVVNVSPSLTQGSSASSLPAATYRLQSVQGPTSYTGGQLSASQWKAAGTPGTVRTLAPQQMTVTLPVSVSSAQMKTAQQVPPQESIQWREIRRPRRPTQIPGEHLFNKQSASGTPHPVISTTVFQPSQGLNVVTSVGASGLSTPNRALGQQAVTVKVSGTPVTSSTVTQPLTIQTTSANNQAATTPSQMSPNTAKKKCKNFLSTLIRLASDQPEQVATNVKNLIQGLIDGMIQPEEFTNQLQKELNSSPQPCLVPFLKKSLPYLRHSLMLRELTIEGVRPPLTGTVTLPPTPTAIPQIQISQARQPVPQTPPQVRVMAPVSSATLTARLAQGPGLQGVIAQPSLVTPRLPTTLSSQTKSLLVASAGATKVSLTNASHPLSTTANAAAVPSASTTSAAVSATVIATPPTKASPASSRSTAASASGSSKEKEKRSYSSLSRDDDDINDVAAMGGVNLIEESQRILAANAEIVGTQIRSCKDETFLFTGPLQKRINSIASKHGLDEVPSDVVALISHATQERLKTLTEKLGVIAEHRLENIKNDSRYEVTQDVKGQLKFLEELDRLEKKRHEEQEREILMRAAKSRSKLEDPEQLKLKQKAKEMQRAEMEELRQREANLTALLAIGPRKKLKTDAGSSGLSQFGLSSLSGQNSTPKPQVRQRVKRANLKDLLFLMEQERETVRTPLLYKSYVK